jgi:hypothetical protein
MQDSERLFFALAALAMIGSTVIMAFVVLSI